MIQTSKTRRTTNELWWTNRQSSKKKLEQSATKAKYKSIKQSKRKNQKHTGARLEETLEETRLGRMQGGNTREGGWTGRMTEADGTTREGTGKDMREKKTIRRHIKEGIKNRWSEEEI